MASSPVPLAEPLRPITYTATAQATTLPSAGPAMVNGLGQRIGALLNITV